MDSEQVMAWVGGYERAWRSGDTDAVEELFTEDAQYRHSPVEPSLVGHEAIKDMWRGDVGRAFEVRSEPVAVEGDRAVVRLEVDYLQPTVQKYHDLWVLHFAADGRVRDFEEWAYWPGRSYSAGE